MKLHNCGITVEATNPQDVARFKKAGYVEVEEKDVKAVEKQPSKSNKKDGDS